MRFFSRQQHFNDVRFRTAVTIALDRRAMIDQFFAGSGDVNPWVSWPVKKWTLPQSELTALPGYRPGKAGRDADIKQAKDLLAVYSNEKGLPEDIPLFVVDDAQEALGLGSIIRDQLAESLGLNESAGDRRHTLDFSRSVRGRRRYGSGPMSSKRLLLVAAGCGLVALLILGAVARWPNETVASD